MQSRDEEIEQIGVAFSEMSERRGAVRNPWPKPVPVRRIEAPNFAFLEPSKPCSYWSDGRHLIAAGKCRCGSQFILAEIEVGTSQFQGAVGHQKRPNTDDKL